MGHKQVLLREDIDNLGARGEIVRVKAGYARNYLLPRSLAVEATASNVKQIESERAALVKREAKERATADAQAEQLRNLTLKFERKVGEAGILYGSVTSMDVAHALKELGKVLFVLLPAPHPAIEISQVAPLCKALAPDNPQRIVERLDVVCIKLFGRFRPRQANPHLSP